MSLSDLQYLKFKTQIIRSNAKKIVDHTEIISINRSKLTILVNDLKKTKNPHNNFITNNMSSVENTIGLLICMSVMNYCYVNPYTRQPYVYQLGNQKLERSNGFFTALITADVNWSDFTSIKKLSIHDWYHILQTNKDARLFNIKERYYDLQGFVNYLLRNKGFKMIKELQDNIFTCEFLFRLLINSGYFKDIFLKRLQVTISLISNLNYELRKKHLQNIELLTAMPDYRIPQVLYNYGIIILNKSLKNKIMNYKVIYSGSVEEVALRASVVVVVQELSILLGECEAFMDNRLWLLSQMKIQNDQFPIPAMLVPSDNY